ncbi:MULTISPECIES: oligosaccharide MFS transporter [Alteromonas]|uniref:Major facilitator superfamily (MFS) profile domain-containing protein n=1 Tax=Alteromonas mediterranea TaxID=314275 RepID=A0AAC9JBN8_9ALTE|nr:oligosaccharide MFS transporter [Alteromonas mediterranea]APD89540.1 hypothetical protein BM524_06890 [Alteromonas mediterranea]QDG38110.1 MFS transporter [Alteromonas mediterranea]
MNKAEKSNQRNYWVSSAYLFSLFGGYALVYSMYAIWLSQTVGLSGKQIGIIFSVNSIAAISLQPLLGFIQDKIHTKQYLLWINAIFLLLTGPFFSFIYEPLFLSNFYLGIFVGAIYIALVFLAMAGVVETYLERLSRYSDFEYGKVRLWGSLGWASTALFGGVLINIGGETIFWIASATAFVPMFILLFVKIRPAVSKAGVPSSMPTLKDILLVLKLPKFYCLSLFVLGVATIYTVYDQQFPVFYASLFLDVKTGNEMYGYLNSLQIFLEAAGFLVAPAIVNRVGIKTGLLLAGLIMIVRMFCSAILNDEVLLSLVKLLHAVELPILMVSIFKYLNMHFDSKLSSTLYLIGFMFVMQLGAGAMAPIFGELYDSFSFQYVYLLMGIIATVCLILSVFLLEKDKALKN